MLFSHIINLNCHTTLNSCNIIYTVANDKQNNVHSDFEERKSCMAEWKAKRREKSGSDKRKNFNSRNKKV